MTFESILIAAVIVLAVSMIVRHRRENPSVDMNHKSLHASNAVSKTPNGPKPAAKEAPAKKKAAPKKKVVKKKTTKKKSTKKKAD